MADGSERVELAVKADYRSAFKSRDFRLYQAARLMVILGAEAQSVAVAWQVYALTHSALDLGYTGLALFLPGIFVMLAAGCDSIIIQPMMRLETDGTGTR